MTSWLIQNPQHSQETRKGSSTIPCHGFSGTKIMSSNSKEALALPGEGKKYLTELSMACQYLEGVFYECPLYLISGGHNWQGTAALVHLDANYSGLQDRVYPDQEQDPSQYFSSNKSIGSLRESWDLASIFTSFLVFKSSSASYDLSLQRQLIVNEGWFSIMKRKKQGYLSRSVESNLFLCGPITISNQSIAGILNTFCALITVLG